MFHWKKKYLNYGDRPDGVFPNILLLHYTGMVSTAAARERLTNPKGDVSAHYLVDDDGSVLEMVSEDKRAWHAGISCWHHEQDINSYSIGVEIVNPGHEFGYHPFPDVQMQSVLKLCREIMSRHDIAYVLAHSDVAPERKKDPGELFDWKLLAENGVGLWPDPNDDEIAMARDIACNDYEAEHLFIELGYNQMAAFIDIVTAFHRHYYPEIFRSNAQGVVCEQTIARLLSLIRQSKKA